MRNIHRYDWLNDYLALKEEIKVTEWRIRKANAEEFRWTEGDLRNVKLAAKSKGSHVLDTIPDMKARIVECKRQQADILDLIASFNDPTQSILKLKYIDGMTLSEIADVLPYSEDTIRKRHAEVHRTLTFLDNWEQIRRHRENRKDWIEPEEAD